ncbi:putative polygalacturonase [Rosa chinensis]|uniref:Putative polygalacturonase n=1 Tax=Rosa chinensis TaxID=74649 RepID=A0A2P6RDZ9_ROSCH|nr:putative polygalacturonase [Rosa chinensis]
MRKLLASFLIVCIFTTSSNFNAGYCQETFNVLDYGAVGDGQTDDSEAFLTAWSALCAAKGTPALVIPMEKTFLLQPTKFSGPCISNGSIYVEILGKIVAPKTPQEWKECEKESWLLFSEVNNLIINGNETGVINGNGLPWWTEALRFFNCNDLQLSGLTHVDSPKGHISILNCTNVIVSNLHIIAPDDSENTDGIDINMSRHVNIHDCIIGTGDDCIAIKRGSVLVNVTNIACGPGHGISVGSIGKLEGAYETVAEVFVRNCTFNGTMNGARIKTWPGGSGYAKNISYEKITLIGVQNPIIIDQNYCNGEHDCGNITSNSAVEVSNVIFNDFRGTLADEHAITFDCSKTEYGTLACLNINMEQINITSIDPEKEISVLCKNVNGTTEDTSPSVHCLQARNSTIDADSPDADSPDPYAYSF